MPLKKLERWLEAHAERRPVATSMATLDGYVAAIVAGPVSISPPDWICPLLAIEWWHAEGRGDLRRRATSHDISNVLSTAPHRFNSRKPNGDVDAHHWCEGFHAAMRPRLLAWAPLLDLGNISHGLLLPILVHCVDDQGHPCSDRP